MAFGYQVLGFGSGGGAVYSVDYLVVAGGGASGYPSYQGGGGAGGYATSYCNSCAEALTVKAGTYNVVVGAGGIGSSCNTATGDGNASTFETISTTGGGHGGSSGAGDPANQQGNPGGSGGGSGYGGPGGEGKGCGNTPAQPTALGGPQGNNGGLNSAGGAPGYGASGGGGAGAVGTNGNT